MLANQAMNICYWMELVTGERNAQKNENNMVSGAIETAEPFIMDSLHLYTHFAKQFP